MSRRIPATWVVGSVGFSVVAAVLVGWGVAANSDDGTISADRFVNGSPQNPTSVIGTATVGQPVPAATFEFLEGGRGSISDFKDKPLVINFWASNCAPCLKEMPAFEAVHQRYGDRLGMLGIDVFESKEAGQEMVRKTGVTYRQARDPSQKLAPAFGAVALPTTVFVSADGTVTEIHAADALDEEELTQRVEGLLG